MLGRFASGVTVVTAISGGAPVGMTCQSFSSVSLDPPLVLFVPAKTSRAWPVIQRSGQFCVNFLAADQAELSNQMASRGADKFAGVDWTPARETGSPILDGTLGYVDCQIHTVHEAGDHYVVIGRVLDLGRRRTTPTEAAAVLPGQVPHRPTRRGRPSRLAHEESDATASSRPVERRGGLVGRLARARLGLDPGRRRRHLGLDAVGRPRCRVRGDDARPRCDWPTSAHEANIRANPAWDVADWRPTSSKPARAGATGPSRPEHPAR